jgi:hypothetical protein
MGAVYLARETALEREVAIKVLPPDFSATKEGRDRFLREARTAARLFHPNIVPLYTFGEVDGTLFFVMGFVPGESLAARMRRRGALGQDETIRILSEIASALEYAHTLGIVHRDIKPDNVLIDEVSGRAMLTDFGVAKPLGMGQTMTVEGSLLGTPHYMSPEQAQGKSDIDHRSDLYSLGVMGYAMLAGRLPFEGTTSEVLLKHITIDPPRLEMLARDVPADLAGAVHRAMAKDPAARWSNARSLRTALSPSEDDEVPPALEGLNNLLLILVVCLLALINLAVWWFGGGEINSGAVAVMAFAFSFIVLILPLLIFEKIRAARKSGIDFDRIRYEILKQPRWWTARYPRRYRAKGDVWDRLPPELQRARNGMALWIVASLILTVPSLVLQQAFESYERRTGRPLYPVALNHATVTGLLGLTVILFVITLFVASRWERYARSRLPDPHLRTHMMGSSTARRAFWTRPEVAALLLPPGSHTLRGAGAALSPRSMAQAIASAIEDWPEIPNDLRSRVGTIVRRSAESVATLDREIDALGQAIDPVEVQRLRAKLEAIGQGEDSREVREVVQKQLELVLSLETKVVDMKSRKVRHVAALQAMWRNVQSGSSPLALEQLAALSAELDVHEAHRQGSGTPERLSDLPTLKS